MFYSRTKTKRVKVGNIIIGGQNKIVIQSMTNTKTANVSATLKQINELCKNGCELVRVAIFDEKDLHALSSIVKKAKCPIIADIHYNYKFAIESIKAGAKKIRINPGNISDQKQLIEIIECAKKHHATIRIGINSGSLPKNIKPTITNIVNVAVNWIKFFESRKFYDLVISLKSSDPVQTRKLYLLASNKIKYPLHLGVTEAGNKIDSAIKSTIGLHELIEKGIGDTIRISISGNPIIEPIIAKKILNACNLKQDIPNVISCPTCGRCLYEFDNVIKKIDLYLQSNPKSVNVAVMGCSVNGIGECQNADIGVYGVSKNKCALMFKGKKIGIYNQTQIIKKFINLYNKL